MTTFNLSEQPDDLFIEPLNRDTIRICSPFLQKFVSTTQKAALPQLEALHKISHVEFKPMGISIRTKPLLIGPSGAGKTATVRMFAEKIGKEVLTINAGSWIPYGARNENYSVKIVHQFICDQWENGGIIFFDEIDKCVPHGGAEKMSEWSHCVFSELLALLDSDNRLLNMGWNQNSLQVLKNGDYMIIGAGAWQHVGKDFSKSKIGFGMTVANAGNYTAEFKKGFGIPDEIAERFSQDIVFIDYPTVDDFKHAVEGIHAQLSIPLPTKTQLTALANSAVEEKRGVRWLENYIVKLLHENPLILQRYTSEPAPLPEKTKKPYPINFAEGMNKFIKMLLKLAEIAMETERALRIKQWETPHCPFNIMLFGADVSYYAHPGMKGCAHELTEWSRKLSNSLLLAPSGEEHVGTRDSYSIFTRTYVLLNCLFRMLYVGLVFTK